MGELLYKDEVYAIIGAAIEVHREMGPGFLEPVYQEALGIEFEFRDIPNQTQVRLQINYKGKQLSKEYIPDYVCFDKIIIELKALERLSGREEAQLLNYLKVSGMRVGVLINFGSAGKLEWKRFIK